MTRPVTTIITGKPGRPKGVRRKVESLVGAAGLAALDSAGLVVVPARILNELQLLVGEQVPQPKSDAVAQTETATV